MTSEQVGNGRLRVLVITEDDPLYVRRFFEVFLAELPQDRLHVVGITVDRAFHEPLTRTARRLWSLYGPLDFARLSGRFALAKARRRSVESVARACGVTLVPASSVNAPEYLDRVAALRPDVIVSVAAPEIFRPALLAAAPLGCLNVHSGRLPVYRGMLPTFWQMLRGEPSVTVTVHEMAERLDAGAVLATEEFPLDAQDRLDRVITGTKIAGARLMLRVLDDLRAGRAVAAPLDMGESRYFSFPTRDDVREFRRRGHALL